MSDGTATQSSVVTIFAIWNTMMGTSLLTMPWAVAQAGLALGIICLLGMGLLCLYTAYRIMDSPRFMKLHQGGTAPTGDEPYRRLEEETDVQVSDNLKAESTTTEENEVRGSPIRGGGDRTNDEEENPVDSQTPFVEFMDVCADVLGPVGRWIAITFSLVALLSALIVFWELMSKFAENLALFAYTLSQHNMTIVISTNLTCPRKNLTGYYEFEADLKYDKSWIHDFLGSRYTWPCLLIVLIFPLINIKSPTFFQRFTSLGTVSVIYLLGYNVFNGIKWGINWDYANTTSIYYDAPFKASFPSLTGVLCLSFFIQNCVLTLLRYQARPENNTRDLCIGFSLVGLTYISIGIPFYLTFPRAKACLEDNFLQNFSHTDLLATVTRAFLMLQYTAVFPQIAFLTRVQILEAIWPGQEYTRLRIFIFNIVIVAICVLVSIFVGDVSLILRYGGALCGLAYVFALPSLIYIIGMRRLGQLSAFSAVFHASIIALGIANFAAQFIPH